MNNYIPADKLIAEIERMREINRKAFEAERIESGIFHGRAQAFNHLFEFITSLQQEQPDKYETALEKARAWMPNVNQGGHAMLIDIFPELGESLDPRYGGRKQEQPEVELDFQVFAKEMDSVFALPSSETENTEDEPLNWEYAIARHFYELGKISARKEE